MTVNIDGSAKTVFALLKDDYYLAADKIIAPTGDLSTGLYAGLETEGRTFHIAGTITANGDGVTLGNVANHKGASSYFENTGSITGANAIRSYGDGEIIYNEGKLTGTANAGIVFDGNHQRLYNYKTGTVEGKTAGVSATGEYFDLLNQGVIKSATGVEFTGDHLQFINRGTIEATGDALKMLTPTDPAGTPVSATPNIVNEGKIIGNVRLGAGNDYFSNDGGTVKGTIYGGKGDDTFAIDRSDLKLFENKDQGFDIVKSSVSYTLKSNFEELDLVGNAHNGTGNEAGNSLNGNDKDNVLKGLGGVDILWGAAGKDKLYGGDGNDRLIGDAGADRLDGGAGRDTVIYDGADAAVIINLKTGKVSGGDATGDVLVSIEDVVGTAKGDTLTGSDGINHLYGNEGADRLNGGRGNDKLTGQSDADTFIFKTGYGKDTVTDFENGVDHINISAWSAITDFSDLKAHHMHQVGADVVISHQADSLTLKGVKMADLDAGDFLF